MVKIVSELFKRKLIAYCMERAKQEYRSYHNNKKSQQKDPYSDSKYGAAWIAHGCLFRDIRAFLIRMGNWSARKSGSVRIIGCKIR